MHAVFVHLVLCGVIVLGARGASAAHSPVPPPKPRKSDRAEAPAPPPPNYKIEEIDRLPGMKRTWSFTGATPRRSFCRDGDPFVLSEHKGGGVKAHQLLPIIAEAGTSSRFGSTGGFPSDVPNAHFYSPKGDRVKFHKAINGIELPTETWHEGKKLTIGKHGFSPQGPLVLMMPNAMAAEPLGTEVTKPRDFTVFLHDANQGSTVAVPIKAEAGRMYPWPDSSVSEDGKYFTLLSHHVDNWSAVDHRFFDSTGKLLLPSDEKERIVEMPVFSADSKRVMVSFHKKGKGIFQRIYDLPSLRPVIELPYSVQEAQLLAGGALLMAKVSEDNDTYSRKLIDVATGKVVKDLPKDFPVVTACPGEKETLIVTSGTNSTIFTQDGSRTDREGKVSITDASTLLAHLLGNDERKTTKEQVVRDLSVEDPAAAWNAILAAKRQKLNATEIAAALRKPRPELTEKEIKWLDSLESQLASDDFRTREKASRQAADWLRTLGNVSVDEKVLPALQRVAARSEFPEARARAEAVLNRYVPAANRVVSKDALEDRIKRLEKLAAP